MSAGGVGVLQRLSARTRTFLSIAGVVVVLDQITKWLAVSRLTTAFEAFSGEALGFGDKLSRFLWQKHPVKSEAFAVLDDFWHFRYVENPGAAWGFLSGSASWFRTPFFLLVSVGAMIFIIHYVRKTTAEQRLLRLALALVFGGALGNFIDRVRLGYVIDFIDWHWFDKATWPTFNIADSGISVGVALMVLEMMFSRTPKSEPEQSAAPK
ncbi:MAG: signal peptidase II [Deltaproteobacteria bacterium]|nr:signal peptidase II [Deltaproteobacteria bacterium]